MTRWRRTMLLASCAALLLAPGLALSAASGDAAQHAPTGCGPADAASVAEGSHVRLYVVRRSTGPAGPKLPLLFACLEPHGHPRLLGAPESGLHGYRGHPVPFAEVRTLRMHAPWVAYAIGVSEVDIWGLDLSVRNLRTNAVHDCPIGSFEHHPAEGPSLTGIEVSGRGAGAWIGARESERLVVACGAAGETILDTGTGIALHSLTLRGSLLSWRDEGEAQLARLTR